MIAITGGGTGGHLAIARVLKEELIKQHKKVIFIGSNNGQDKAWFENDSGFEKCYFFDTTGVVNKGKIGKILSMFKILKYTIKCFSIFKAHKITKVISVGGYSSASASFGAILFNKDFYIHEQNASVGALNKLLQPFAKKFFSSYSFNFKNYIYTPYPINNIFFENVKIKKNLETIMFLGGSQGATFINNFAKSVAMFLKNNNIKIIHQCGKYDYEELKSFYEDNSIEVELFAFSNKLYEKIKKSDFAVSRSGASTFWELVASCTPALFVPFPHAASNHQYFNAKKLEDKGLCFIKTQQDLTIEYFYELIKTIDLESISRVLQKEITPHGATKLLEETF